LRMETTGITLAPVDPALLDAPASYAKAPDAKAFLAAVERAANEERWAAAKAAGTIRIGVVTPSNKSGEDVSGDALAKELLDGLTAAPYEAVPLLSASQAEQDDEARKKECDYVIYTELTSLKTTTPGKMGSVLRRASGGGSPSELHEAKFDYRVFQTGGQAPRAAKSASAKTGAFTLKRAAGLARFAGRLYFGASTGMMRAMLSQAGGVGGGVPSRGADPSLNAVSLVANL